MLTAGEHVNARAIGERRILFAIDGRMNQRRRTAPVFIR